ncbi:tryptophan-rich sensory protein [Nocardiopsis sp. EMB25]|uniref:TspO/MBR family protein n=1 Tax=Nocardiopsis sp. EMB25 TaxID=2835867 RepID=UPI002283DC5F|nr:TspO/MBR family protein [Nocardiopsis sp. EMB25]MCY9785343.1 tryptophan-rich sensory protein [Nocardiopsis sp. EMB25]
MRGVSTTQSPGGGRGPGLVSLAVFVGAAYAVAVLGSLAASDAGAVYASLERPGWAPPSWLFAPVWTVLYGMIGVAAWLAWRRTGRDARTALVWWWVQLGLNAAWTPLFFGLRQYGLAFLDICLLLVALVITVVAFWCLRRVCALLLVPYLLWVAFASALNLNIWLNNA